MDLNYYNKSTPRVRAPRGGANPRARLAWLVCGRDLRTRMSDHKQVDLTNPRFANFLSTEVGVSSWFKGQPLSSEVEEVVAVRKLV